MIAPNRFANQTDSSSSYDAMIANEDFSNDLL